MYGAAAAVGDSHEPQPEGIGDKQLQFALVDDGPVFIAIITHWLDLLVKPITDCDTLLDDLTNGAFQTEFARGGWTWR
jgi:hypothetical protein